MKKVKRLLLTIISFIVALGLAMPSLPLAKASPEPAEYQSLYYFNITEGFGIKYHVTDDYQSLDCNIRAVSQYFETGKPDGLDFVFTLTKEGTEGRYFRNSCISGEDSRITGGKEFTRFYAGFPVGNQANFYRNFSLPPFFDWGDQWSLGDKAYSVEHVGVRTINGIEFNDCIKITIDDSGNAHEYLRGTGYFILARDIGIVELVFDRTDGTRVMYEYVSHDQLTRHRISGTITHGGVPVQGIIVQVANANWGTRSVTDSNGAFSIQAYGPDVVLRIGYDKDNDDVFEFDDPNYPIEYCVNNITSDISGLNIMIEPAPSKPSSIITQAWTSDSPRGPEVTEFSVGTEIVYVNYAHENPIGSTHGITWYDSDRDVMVTLDHVPEYASGIGTWSLPYPNHEFWPEGSYRADLFINSILLASVSWTVTLMPTSSTAQREIAFTRSVDGSYEIAVINPDGSGLTSLSERAYSPAWSPEGTKIAFVSQRDGNEEIYVMKADGTNVTRITQSPEWESNPAWSPDGSKIAFTRRSFLGNGDIWVMNASGSGQIQLTNHPDEDTSPSWSPNGTKIAFVSYREGYQDIWVMNADGSEPTNLINDSDWDFGDNEPSWSPDGSKIAFAADRERRGGRDIYIMGPDGSNIIRLTTPIGQNHSPNWSPNGTKIAFTSNRDGNYEIYIMNADGTSETRITYEPVNESQPNWGIAVDTGVIEKKPDIGSVAPIDFGNVSVGNSSDRTTTIYNKGNSILTIDSITRTSGSSDFTYISPSTPFNIETDDSQTITIRFTPSSQGTKSAIFNVNSNDLDEANVTINVSGKSVIQKGAINVTSDSSSASFTLSGPASYSGITPWSTINAPAGTYTITWQAIARYATPPLESNVLTQDGAISFHGPYQLTTGNIKVTSDPPGASFTLSGPANYGGITPWSEIDTPEGTYTITWAPISGYRTPSEESNILTQGETIFFRGGYITVPQPTAAARIDGYSPSSPVEMTVGGSTTISVTFTNTGNTAWNFIAGATVWDSGGNQVANYSKALSTALQPGQQTTIKWTHTVNESDDFWLQFGIWKQISYTSENLLDKRPSPSQKLITGHIAPPANQYILTIPYNLVGEVILSPKEESFQIVISPKTGNVEGVVYYYKVGTEVTLTAKAAVEDYVFTHWGGGYVSGSRNPETIVMDSDKSITAYFQQITSGLEVANFDYWSELIALREVVQNVLGQARGKLGADEEQELSLLTRADALISKIERGQPVRYPLREGGPTITHRVINEIVGLVLGFPTGLVLSAAGWGAENVIEAVTESLTLGELGLLNIKEAGQGVIYIAYKKDSQEIWVNINLYDPVGQIYMFIPVEVERKEVFVPIWEHDWLSGSPELLYAGMMVPALEIRMTPTMDDIRVFYGRDALVIAAESPVEIRVYDSKGRVTGIVNGEIKEDIPNSGYYENTVIILSPLDSYSYEVTGTGEGSYGLTVTSIAEQEISSYSLADTPISTKAIHQYTINWDVLAEGEKGVTMKIDSDGDGTFEEIKYLGQEGTGFLWVWIVVAGVSGLLGILVGAFMVWRRMSREQVSKG